MAENPAPSYENDVFVTQTDVAYAKAEQKKVTVLVFFGFSLLACFCFLVGWQLFVFFEAIILIATIATYVTGMRTCQQYVLRFEGDRLYITNQKTQETHVVYDVLSTDFLITQTEKEKATDYCSLMIKNTVFGFAGVQNYRQLKEYIFVHFEPHY